MPFGRKLRAVRPEDHHGRGGCVNRDFRLKDGRPDVKGASILSSGIDSAISLGVIRVALGELPYFDNPGIFPLDL